MFGGLNFVLADYYDFVLRLEYVFVRCLASTKLAVLENSLVLRVLNELCGNMDMKVLLIDMMGGDDDVEDDFMV